MIPSRSVGDCNFSVGRAVDVDGRRNPVRAITDRLPRERRDRTILQHNVDPGERCRAGGVVADRVYAVRLERLRRPDEVNAVRRGDGRVGDVGERGDVVVVRAVRARQRDHAIKLVADVHRGEVGVVSLTANEVPTCDGPVCASAGGGPAVLEDGLDDSAGLLRDERVEVEDGLAVLGGGDGGDLPGGGERGDGGGGQRVEPLRVGDPAGLEGLDRGSGSRGLIGVGANVDKIAVGVEKMNVRVDEADLST